MSEWQRIEEVKYDEPRHVMLWFPKGEHVIALYLSAAHYECVGYMGHDDPTHVLPLPAPPKAQ